MLIDTTSLADLSVNSLLNKNRDLELHTCASSLHARSAKGLPSHSILSSGGRHVTDSTVFSSSNATLTQRYASYIFHGGKEGISSLYLRPTESLVRIPRAM